MNWFHFFQNKRRLVILIIGLLILLLGGGFLVWAKLTGRLGSRADTLDSNLIKQIGAQEPLINPDLLVKMPSQYSKEEIEKAIVSQSIDQAIKKPDIKVEIQSGKKDEILETIKEESKKVVDKAEAKSIQTQSQAVAAGQKDELAGFKGDIIIYLADSQGNLINPQLPPELTVNPSTVAASVADNFEFDASVPAGLQQSYIEAYSKIEAFYGPRSDNRKIKVYYDPNSDRGWYDQYSNEIHSDNRFIDSQYSQYLVTHELTHAFHGLFCQTPLWEEGMTEATAEILAQQNNIESYNLINYGYRDAELINLPFRDYHEATDPWAHIDPYAIGSMVFAKIYQENPNFFKQFNPILYSQSNTIISELELINIASKVVTKIEEKPVLDWFSHQYAFFRPKYIADDPVYFTPWGGRLSNYGTFLQYFEYFNNSLSDTISLKIYNSNNQLLGEVNKAKTISGGRYVFEISYADIFGAQRNATYDNYEGLLKIDITTSDNPNNHKIQYMIKSEQNYYPRLTGLVVGSTADSVKIQNLTAGWSIIAPIKNGLFIVNDAKGRQAGKYKVEVYKSGQLVNTGNRYFNLAIPTPDSGYPYPLVLQENYQTYTFQAQPQPSTDAVTIKTTAGQYASQTMLLNGFPIERVWDKDHEFSVYNLQPITTYQYQISHNSEPRWGDSVFGLLSGSFKTLPRDTTNLLQNGSFENDLTSWNKIIYYAPGNTLTKDGTIRINTVYACVSGKCLVMHKNNADNIMVSQNIASLTVGKTYELSAKFEIFGCTTDFGCGPNSKGSINIYDATAKKSNITTLVDTHQRQDIRVQVTPDASTTGHKWTVFLYGANASPGYIAYDDVKLEEVAQVATLIKNGNLEQGDKEWAKIVYYAPTNTLEKNGLAQIINASDCYNGQGWCALLRKNNADNIMYSQKITTGPLEPNKKYRFSAKYKLSGGLATSKAYINFYDATDKKFYATKAATQGSWQDISVELTPTDANAAHTWTAFLYGTDAAPGSVVYDDVKLEKIN